jgi:hypothetical protein
MREYNFFWSFKMAIKNSFFVVRSVKIVKSIGDNLRLMLIYSSRSMQKSHFFGHFSQI